MKKSFIKTIAVSIITVLTLALTSCTYVANGSVIQDVNFEIGYEVGGEAKTINSTLSLYKTFAPETTKRVIKLVKDGFYKDTVLTLSKQQDYVVVGGFDFTNGDYAIKQCNEQGVKGEFTLGGFQSRNKLRAGALVMLRDFDYEEENATSKYDTAKGSFAIVLTDSNSVFSKDTFCIFGYIDDDSLKALQEAVTENTADSDGYYKMRYVGERVNGVQTYEKAVDYYFDSNNDYYKDGPDGKLPLEYKTEDDVDYSTYEIISSGDNLQDVFTLPSTIFKIKSTKLK